MAWDTSQPQNTTKIRNLGVVIRPNWLAIEEADSTFQPEAINFTDRTAAGIAVNPTAIATSVIVYSKQDSAGDPQLYAIDPSSVITQLTGIGSIRAWGQFNGSTATLAGSFNIASVTRNSAGNYSIAFSTALSSANYSVVVTPQMTSAFTTGGIVGVDSLTVNGFNIYARSLTAASGVDLNPINFIVIG